MHATAGHDPLALSTYETRSMHGNGLRTMHGMSAGIKGTAGIALHRSRPNIKKVLIQAQAEAKARGVAEVSVVVGGPTPLWLQVKGGGKRGLHHPTTIQDTLFYSPRDRDTLGHTRPPTPRTVFFHGESTE